MLTDLFQINDIVVMKMDKEARSWGRSGPEDGTRGRVINFSDAIREVPYGFYGERPGIYKSRGAPLIHWEGLDFCSYTGEVEMVDVAEYERRHALRSANRKKGELMTESSIFFCDLPDLPFMSGDKVHVEDSTFGSFDTKITSVDYYSKFKEKTRDDGSEYPLYTIKLKGGGTTTLTSKEISLVERGNMFHWYKGDKANIKFDDLKEELAFALCIGKARQVRNHRNNLYDFSLEEALEDIRENRAHALSVSHFFGVRSLDVIFVDDEDLAQRTRAEVIKGFAEPQDAPMA